MEKDDKPNILLIFPDQHRGDWLPYPDHVFHELGMGRLPLRMPVIESLMQNGTTFVKTITPSPLCAPARSCLASGLRYGKTGVMKNSYNHPLDKITFYTVLKNNGYTVGGCGKFDLRKAEHNFNGTGWVPKMSKLGFSKGYAIDNGGKHDAIRCATTFVDDDGKRKPLDDPMKHDPTCPYMKYLKDLGLMMTHVNDFKKRRAIFGLNYATFPTELPDHAYCDNWITQNAIKIIRKFPRNRPWFLQVNFVCPHEPWDVTKSMRKKWENISFPLPNRGNDYFKEEEIKVRQNYAAMLENIDKNTGLIIEEIRKREDLDNTLIIYSSDHGEMLGDFSLWGKSKPFRGSIHVPLVISGPNIRKGIISNQLVELQDLTRTIIEYAGLSMPTAEDSISLVPILNGRGSKHRKFQASALNTARDKGWKLIADNRYKLVKFDEKKEILLFDLQVDPWENNNISEDNPEIVEKLLDQLNHVYQPGFTG
ncbi:MAG: sulfatase family protein [Promethearchaeota archaeon]